MSVFEKIVKKAKQKAEQEFELLTKLHEQALLNQKNLEELLIEWRETLFSLVGEANAEIKNVQGSAEFHTFEEGEKDDTPHMIGFAFEKHRFVMEIHDSFNSHLNRKMIAEIIYYYKGSSEKYTIKAVDALKTKPFLINGVKNANAKDFFIVAISDAIEWWKLLAPNRNIA